MGIKTESRALQYFGSPKAILKATKVVNYPKFDMKMSEIDMLTDKMLCEKILCLVGERLNYSFIYFEANKG